MGWCGVRWWMAGREDHLFWGFLDYWLLRWREGLVDAEFGECGVEVGVAVATDFILGRVRRGVEWHACESILRL